MCKTEEEARELIATLPEKGKWPCLFTESDTSGEKDFEEFYMEGEQLDLSRFENLGIVKSELSYENKKLDYFLDSIQQHKAELNWDKSDIVKLFNELLPDFKHTVTGKYLDSKM